MSIQTALAKQRQLWSCIIISNVLFLFCLFYFVADEKNLIEENKQMTRPMAQ